VAKPVDLDLGNWNNLVVEFHNESDRGSAMLAGSFAEHTLGIYLKFRIKKNKLEKLLFDSNGPLSNFSQKISIAYAFDLIKDDQYRDLETIRKIRNEFAHNPFHSTFKDNKIRILCENFSMYEELDFKKSLEIGLANRMVYLISCGITVGSLLDYIENKKKEEIISATAKRTKI
jgi:hypothetical protein